jgi:hypothetical protein
MPKLTKSLIDSLIAIDGKPTFVWDILSGFGVKVTPSGKKTFVAKYRTNGGGRGAQQRWLTLGQFGHIEAELIPRILSDIFTKWRPAVVSNFLRQPPF